MLSGTALVTTFRSPWSALHLQHSWRFFALHWLWWFPVPFILFFPCVLQITFFILDQFRSTEYCLVSISLFPDILEPLLHSLFDVSSPKSLKKPYFLETLHESLYLSLLREKTNKQTKNSINPPLTIRLIKKMFASVVLSLHEAVFSYLALNIQALGDIECHFNPYFSMLGTTVHDEASRHYSNINSSNKINTMAILKVRFKNTI